MTHPLQLLAVRIPGQPAPQGTLQQAPGSLRGVRQPTATITARARVATTLAAAWHNGAVRPAYNQAVAVAATFTFTRPDTHYRPASTKLQRPARTQLRDEAPPYPTGGNSPDVDKLCRLLGDALQQAGILTDDALIVSWQARKMWAAAAETVVVVAAVPGHTGRLTA